ncbi:unnamed protein product [Rotaria socialis]
MHEDIACECKFWSDGETCDHILENKFNRAKSNEIKKMPTVILSYIHNKDKSFYTIFLVLIRCVNLQTICNE